MPLSIKDDEADRLVRRLSELTGESLTTAVRKAVEERLQRLEQLGTAPSVRNALREIRQRCAAMPRLDHRSPDEILGYDEHGLPT